jgi:hypothetical protein
MKTTHVKLDSYGRLAVGGIHDAVVQAFEFDLSGGFKLRLRGQAGEERLLSLRGVARFGFNDFVNGAIVSDVFCWEVGGAILSEICTDAWRVVLGGNYVEDDLDALIKRLTAQYQGYLLVFVECSYGGSIVVICNDLALESPD